MLIKIQHLTHYHLQSNLPIITKIHSQEYLDNQKKKRERNQYILHHILKNTNNKIISLSINRNRQRQTVCIQVLLIKTIIMVN